MTIILRYCYLNLFIIKTSPLISLTMNRQVITIMIMINHSVLYYIHDSLESFSSEHVLILWKRCQLQAWCKKGHAVIFLPNIINHVCFFLISWYVSIPQFFQFWDNILIIKLKKQSLVIELTHRSKCRWLWKTWAPCW